MQALRLCRSLGKLRGEMFCLVHLALANFYMGDYAAARQGYEQVLPIAQRVGYRWVAMRAQRGLGEVLSLEGDYTRAQTVLVNAVTMAHDIGVGYDESWALATLVRLHSQLGDTGGAGARLEQLLHLMAEVELTPDCQAATLRARALVALDIGDHQQALANAEQGLQLSEEFDIPSYRADAAVILGHARASLNQLADAAAAYQQAITWYMKLDNAPLANEPQAGLAELALAQGDHVRAQTLVEASLPVLDEHPCACVKTPFYAHMVCYRVLEANHDRRCITVLQTAQQRLQERARTIADNALRRSFLENVATHRAILTAAAAHITVPPTRERIGAAR